MEDSEFQYTALPSGHIRLLQILPAENEDDPLECLVQVASLDEAAESYAALSYTWGAPDFDHALICDGSVLPITRNLYRALWRFRRQPLRSQQNGQMRTVWADAVCINQTDNDEKVAQILLMQRIYQQAAMIYVFLGDAADHPNMPNILEHLDANIFQAARMYSRMSIPLPQLIAALANDKDATVPLLLDQLVAASQFPSAQHITAWSAYQVLLTRPWFSRIWVVQEASAHPDRTVVVVDKYLLSWKQLSDLNNISFLLLKDNLSNPAFSTSVVHKYKIAGEAIDATEAMARWKANRVNLKTMQDIGNLAKKRIGQGPESVAEGTEQEALPGLRLFELIKRCCKFKSTDKRDALYGLLGLSSDASSAPRPDYGKTAEEIFRQFTVHFLSQGHGIELLSMASSGGFAESSTRPSWIPDFSSVGGNVPGNTDGWAQRHFTRFRAGGTESAQFHVESNDRLVVQGAVVLEQGEIASLGPSFYPMEHFLNRNEMEAPLKLFEAHVVQWDKASLAFVQEQHAAGKLSSMPQASTAAAPTLEPMALYNVVLATGDEEIHKHKSDESIMSHLGETTYSAVIGLSEDISTRTRVSETMQERRLAVTKDGLLGIVPHVAAVGDRLCVVRGAPAPFVMRHSGSEDATYTLVGDAYVQGIMKGEVEALCTGTVVIV